MNWYQELSIYSRSPFFFAYGWYANTPPTLHYHFHRQYSRVDSEPHGPVRARSLFQQTLRYACTVCVYVADSGAVSGAVAAVLSVLSCSLDTAFNLITYLERIITLSSL